MCEYLMQLLNIVILDLTTDIFCVPPPEPSLCIPWKTPKTQGDHNLCWNTPPNGSLMYKSPSRQHSTAPATPLASFAVTQFALT